jgi:hypothetical protein
MIATIYVNAKSKADLNRCLQTQQGATGIVYEQFDSQVLALRSMPAGSVVKIYERFVGGSPFARAYGNIAFKSDGTVYVK